MIGDDPIKPYEPDEAFLIAAMGGDVIGGVPLEKLSLERITAARAMGCMAPKAFTYDAALAFWSTGNYPNLPHDLMCILWLCTLKERVTLEEYGKGELTPILAFNNPTAARSAAYRWAEANQIHDETTPEFSEALATFKKLVCAIHGSSFEPQLEGEVDSPPTPPPKARPGPPNLRKSSRMRRKKPGTLRGTVGKP